MTPALILLTLLSAGATEKQVFTVDTSGSTVRFHVKHKLHKVDGSSKSIEGKAIVDPEGRALAMVRIRIASFDSGDANRDAHMRETLEEGRYPYVVFKGISSLGAPIASGKPVEFELNGELDFHGVKRQVELPASVELAGDGSATVRGTIRISLEAYRVERPSLLFVKLDDDCTIEFDLTMRSTR